MFIDTAGASTPQKANPRKEALAEIRRVMRKPDATDAEFEDALEALIEVSTVPVGE